MPYADRRNKQSKADIAALSKWANHPAPASAQKVCEERRKLWHDLNRYVRQEGGAIVSLPYSRTIRIEIPRTSTLATKLAAFHPHHSGSVTRVTSDGIVAADVLVIDLPS